MSKTSHIEVADMLLANDAQISAINGVGMTPLHCAIQKGISSIVEHLLNHGADVNCSSRCGNEYTPLHYACDHRNVQIVKLLLSHGADINARTKDGLTALHIAAWRRKKKLMKLLLDQEGTDVNARNYMDGSTILQIAFKLRDFGTLQYILESRPDVNIEINKSLLPEAVRETKYTKKRNIVNTLMKYGFNIVPEDANDANLLHAAIKNGHLNVVKDLLKCGAHVHLSRRFGTGCTLLHIAARGKNIEVAKLLIQHGINVNARNDKAQTPIFLAIEKSNVNMTKWLLSSGANIYDGHDLFRAAIESNCIEIVKIIFQLSPGLNISAVDESGMTPLHYVVNRHGMPLHDSVRLGYTIDDQDDRDLIRGELAKFCLSNGASVDVQNKKGYTALHAAVAQRYTKVVEILLDYNADVNAVDESDGDKTPLHYAAAGGYERICRMLLKNGAKVNAKEKINRRTALHAACEGNHGNIVKILLAFGAEIECRDNLNRTPLHCAVVNDSSETINILLHEFCAEVDSTDKYGKTALHIAMKGRRCNSMEVLLDCGSDFNSTFNNRITRPNYMSGCMSGYLSYDIYATDYHHEIFKSPHAFRIFKQHIAKINALNLFVSDRNLRLLDSSTVPLQYNCKQEIEKLKSTNINDSTVSFYDILTKRTMQVAMYAENESIVKVLESGDYKKIFPIYFGMIRNRFRKGQILESLLNPSTRALSYFFGFDLPECFCMQLFSYLSINDLKNLIKASFEDGRQECVN